MRVAEWMTEWVEKWVGKSVCEVGRFKEVYRRIQPQISSNKLYSIFLNDNRSDCSLKERILSLYFMHSSWIAEVGIDRSSENTVFQCDWLVLMQGRGFFWGSFQGKLVASL